MQINSRKSEMYFYREKHFTNLETKKFDVFFNEHFHSAGFFNWGQNHQCPWAYVKINMCTQVKN